MLGEVIFWIIGLDGGEVGGGGEEEREAMEEEIESSEDKQA